MPRSVVGRKKRYDKRKMLGLCIDCSEPPRVVWNGFVRCEEHHRKTLAYAKSHHHLWKKPTPKEARLYWLNLRKEVISAYGGKCKCCGESHFPFLTMDHIKGGGNKWRKENGTSHSFYLWLRRNHFPKHFQVLCWNCNLAKQMFGANKICPHQMKNNNWHKG